MDLDQFWQIVEDARASAADPVDGADVVAGDLVTRLAALAPDEIVDFHLVFEQVRSTAFRWDVWGAAYLINGGCSDDSFLDFQGWLAAQGRKAWDAAISDPDSLADLLDRPDRPGVGSNGDTFSEEMAFAASSAHERASGDGEAFWKTLDLRESAAPDADEQPRISGPAGEQFDFDDAEQLRARLPRLSLLYPPPG